jgi:hypothetical protein
MAINFLPRVEVPKVEEVSRWNFYNFLKDSVFKMIDAFTQNDAAWKRPNLLGGWQHYTDFSLGEVAYRKDGAGVVWVTGAITGGGTEEVFRLPVGYRPSHMRLWAAGAIPPLETLMFVDKEGTVGVVPTDDMDCISLDGITFRAER